MARKPEPEHPNFPSPEAREAYFLSAVRKHDSLDEMIANANKARSMFRKELKSMGFKMKTFDRVLGEREIDRKEIKEDLADEMRMRRWLQLPTGEQAALFPADAMPGTEDAAFLAGYRAGIAGKGKRQPPEEFSTGKQAQAWLEGWDAGQAKIGADFFGKKDYTKIAAAAEKSGKAAGPSGAKERVDPKAEKAKKDADNVVPLKPAPTVPTNPPKPKPDTAALDDVVKRVAKKKPTKAEEAAANGGVGGLAPPGARKGGGDFDDDLNPIESKKPTAADNDLDLDMDEDDDRDLDMDEDDLDEADA